MGGQAYLPRAFLSLMQMCVDVEEGSSCSARLETPLSIDYWGGGGEVCRLMSSVGSMRLRKRSGADYCVCLGLVGGQICHSDHAFLLSTLLLAQSKWFSVIKIIFTSTHVCMSKMQKIL